jgi:Leucine-rich repeat (LRR) protein
VKKSSEGIRLEMESKELEEIPEVDSEILKTVDILKLSNNLISRLPSTFISSLEHITSIYLSFNKLRNLEPPFGDLKTLKTLYLDSNKFRTVPLELCKLTALTELNLANNRLREIPSQIQVMKNLRVLNLVGNRLKEVPLEMGHLNANLDLKVDFRILQQVKGETMIQFLQKQLIKRNLMKCDIAIAKELKLREDKKKKVSHKESIQRRSTSMLEITSLQHEEFISRSFSNWGTISQKSTPLKFRHERRPSSVSVHLSSSFDSFFQGHFGHIKTSE